MTDSEVEPLVLDVVRRYTQNESASADSDFKKDLRLSDAGREMLWASLAQAFAAHGANLPSYRFYLSDFLACPTPAAVRDAIRAKVFKVAMPKSAEAPAATAPAPGTEPAAGKAKPVARKPAAQKKTAAKKPAAKKSAAGAKGRRGKR
jgi:hypothetical protein